MQLTKDIGNSGAVVASRIANSESHPTVLLIEAGGENKSDELYVPSDRFRSIYHHPEIRVEYKTTAQKHLGGRVLDYLRGKGLGGSSIANFLGYIRGSASDYNTWAEIAGDGAYKWENVLQQYKEIENLSFEDDGDENQWVKPYEAAHSQDGPLGLELFSRKQWPLGGDILMKASLDFGWPLNRDQNSGDPIGVGVVTTTTYKGSRTTSATAFLNDPPSNLTIWTNTVAQRIILESGPGETTQHAAGIILANGQEIRAENETILSLGSIDTPKILLLSGIGPEEELRALGIPCLVNSPRVGKDLIDHNYIAMRWGCSSGLSDRIAFQSNNEGVLASREQWLQDHTGHDAVRNLGNLAGFLKLDPGRYSGEELEKLEPLAQNWINQADAPQFEVFLAGDVPRVWDKTHGEDAIGICVMLMNPQSRGSVTLQSKDPAAMPQIDVNFLSHPYDRKTFVDATREVLRFVKSEGLSKHIKSDFHTPKTDSEHDVLDFIKRDVMSVLHPVGTVRMGGPEDQAAPLDSDMCVRGVRNLRVVDLSVCPIITRYASFQRIL